MSDKEMVPAFVVFAVPSGAQAPKLGFMISCLRLQAYLFQKGVAHAWLTKGGDPYLAKVRNALVADAIDKYPEATHFFFLDDDIEFEPEPVLDLITSGHDVCCGVYPKKSDTDEWPCELQIPKATMRPEMKDGWVKANGVPTGFLCIRMHVLKAMAATALTYLDQGGKRCWNIFEMGFSREPRSDGTDGQWWGEDYAWARKYREMGGEIWIKADIEFGHTGPKTWRGKFSDRVEVASRGVMAWDAEGKMRFFATEADVCEGWSTTNPQPVAEAAD